MEERMRKSHHAVVSLALAGCSFWTLTPALAQPAGGRAPAESERPLARGIVVYVVEFRVKDLSRIAVADIAETEPNTASMPH
jgi:hypothetical protein